MASGQKRFQETIKFQAVTSLLQAQSVHNLNLGNRAIIFRKKHPDARPTWVIEHLKE
jgi:hypothetical protein